MSTVVEPPVTSRTAGPPPPPRKGPGAKAEAWSRRLPLLPALIFLIVLTQLPFIVTLGVSFMNWNAYYPEEGGLAGFDNYVRVLTDVSTRNAIITTVVLTVTVVVVSLLLGLGIALLLDRQFRGRGVCGP